MDIRSFFSHSEQANLSKDIRGWLVDALLLAALVMAIWGLWSWKNANNVAGAVSAKANTALDSLSGTLTHLNHAAGQVEQTASDLHGVAATANTRLPEILDDVHQDQIGIQTELSALRGATVQLQCSVKANGDAAAGLITHLDAAATGPDGLIPQVTAVARHFDGILTGPDVIAAIGSFKTAMGDLADGASHLKLIVDDPELARQIKETFANVDVTSSNIASATASLAGVAADAKRAADIAVDKISPKPAPKGFRAKLGYYALRVLGFVRDVGGVTFLVLKIANGL
ncbi:MAG TPA: hypothetical protein VJX67_26590 [Blastocatellia bacterium]|nr:hypothetical protein [Blastocatellia bacterium]